MLFISSHIAYRHRYTSNWTDYSDVHVKRDTYLANMIALNQLEWNTTTIERINKTVDKNIWQMNPPTVNAYYDPTLNTYVGKIMIRHTMHDSR